MPQNDPKTASHRGMQRGSGTMEKATKEGADKWNINKDKKRTITHGVQDKKNDFRPERKA
jgi:hypothetical protein